MSLLHEILDYNAQFVENRGYEPYSTTPRPQKRLLIVSCMDTRLTELLHKALNLKNGDAKFLKNAGAIITDPFGSMMKSILVAVYALSVDEIMVIGHYRCGMANLDSDAVVRAMKERGIADETLDVIERSGIHMDKWLNGFTNVEENVRNSARIIQEHPLLPASVPVHGLVIDPDTGKLDLLIDGYQR